MTDTTQGYEGWIGRTAVDQDGDKIGKIEEIYLDDNSGQPEWLAIKTGLFGSNLTFAPLSGSTADGEDLRLPYAKDLVKDAPNVAADGHLEPDEEATLYRHYGRDAEYEAPAADRDTSRSTGQDTSGPETDSAMTRSEEELAVGTRSKETGRVRLRKYVVTENVTTTVPVSREEVRIEREPITDANRDAAVSGSDISEEEHEMVLMEEEVVVDKRVVPKERVRLEKDVVTGEEQVSDEVRKERIEIEGDDEIVGRDKKK
ncbi:MAG: PRC and DUF2382 domain-containing protein [Acidimicrobiales bacterium]